MRVLIRKGQSQVIFGNCSHLILRIDTRFELS